MTSIDWANIEALQRTDVGRWTPQPDVEAQAAVQARRDALERFAPAVATAWQLVAGFNAPVVALDPGTHAPVAELADVAALLDHFEARPRDHVGVLTGPRGGWTLVGVAVGSWAGWQGWLHETAGTETGYVDGGGQRAIRRELRPYGEPGLVGWQPPEQPPGVWSSGVQTGARADDARWLLRARVAQADRGGYVLFGCLPDRGRLPRFGHGTGGRQLAGQVRVLGDGQVVPVWAVTGDGWRLELGGWPANPVPTVEGAAPGWFISRLGGRW